MSKHINEIELIALDIDGTLINNEGNITPYTEQVIDAALQKKKHIILSAGRPLPFCQGIATQLNLTNYIITNNGAEIWRTEKDVLERHLMDSEHIKTLWEFGAKRELHMWMVAVDELFRNSTCPESFDQYEWLKFGYGRLDPDTSIRLREMLSHYEDELEITSSSETNIEINRIGVNKSVALQKVCHELGIAMNDVMAIGDNLNDLQMIQDVGFGVAVGNADEIIKERAAFITDTNEADGVAKAIEQFVL